MAAGVGALGVDRAGHQLDEGLQQLFLLLQQALILDGGGRGARQRLDQTDARGQFTGRAVRQDQQQAADQLLAMVAQGLGHQLAGAGEGAPVGQMLLPALLVDGEAEPLAPGQLAKQGLLPADLPGRQRRFAPQRLHRHHPLLLSQVETTPFGLHRGDGFVQDAAEQGVEAVFGRQRPSHVHEIAEGQPHA